MVKMLYDSWLSLKLVCINSIFQCCFCIMLGRVHQIILVSIRTTIPRYKNYNVMENYHQFCHFLKFQFSNPVVCWKQIWILYSLLISGIVFISIIPFNPQDCYKYTLTQARGGIAHRVPGSVFTNQTHRT